MKVAFIGFGNAVCHYHLPYIERIENIRVKYIYRREIDRIDDTERETWYPNIIFTTDIDQVMKDPEVNLIIVCTHLDTHSHYARLALENNKNVLVEKPFAHDVEEAKEIFDLAKSKGLIAMANQNRRYDGDFLTLKKVLDSGVLGNIVEIQSHYHYFNPNGIKKGGFGLLYGLAVHTIDQMVSLYGKPDNIHYDIRSFYYPGEGDDYIDIDFYYGNMKVTIKCGLIVKIGFPKFIVHGDKGSFIKFSSGHQKKNPEGPTRVSFEPESESNWGRISYIDDNGNEHNEKVKSEVTDYGILYEKLDRAINQGEEKPIKDEEVLTVLEIIAKGLKKAKETGNVSR